MNVFVDASFLFALYNSDDEFHGKSRQVLIDLGETVRLVTSNIALAETVNLTFKHKGAAKADNFLRIFEKSGISEVFLTRKMYARGYRILFRQQSRRGLNLFDCFHLAVMKTLGLEKMLTFDQDFAQEVEVWP